MAGRFNALLDDTAPAIVPPPERNALAPPPSWADATAYNAQAAQDYIAQQRAISAQRGLWDEQGMTTAGVRDAAGQLTNMLATSTSAPGFRAYHGSPHSFERFDTSKIGTGEGAQAYGHGLYLADKESTAQGYRDDLTTKRPSPELIAAQNEYNAAYNAVGNFTGASQKEFDAAIAARDAARTRMQQVKADWEAQPKPSGKMYEVQVNADPAHFLDWDKPLAEQSPHVQAKIANLQTRNMLPRGWTADDMAQLTGGHLYQELQHRAGASPNVSALLHEPVPGTDAGIPGIRYLDAGSRAGGQGSSNHVIFDANTIEILRKYGIAGLMAGGAGAAAATARQPQEPPT